MTCEHALSALLDADLSDAIGGVTPLAVHVRGCARCRRVAEQLMTDTRLLASAVIAAPARHRRVTLRGAVVVPATVAAAALLVMVTMRQPAQATRSTVVTLPATIVDAPPPARPNAKITTPVRRAAPPQLLRAFPRAQPVAAVRLAGSVAVDPPPVSNAVTVTPPSGTNALVIHTTDPKLVVVWLY